MVATNSVFFAPMKNTLHKTDWVNVHIANPYLKFFVPECVLCNSVEWPDTLLRFAFLHWFEGLSIKFMGSSVVHCITVRDFVRTPLNGVVRQRLRTYSLVFETCKNFYLTSGSKEGTDKVYDKLVQESYCIKWAFLFPWCGLLFPAFLLISPYSVICFCPLSPIMNISMCDYLPSY